MGFNDINFGVWCVKLHARYMVTFLSQQIVERTMILIIGIFLYEVDIDDSAPLIQYLLKVLGVKM